MKNRFLIPTHEESVPFASQSGEMVDIFLHEETKPTFRMTLEGATDFQKKLFEKLSPFLSTLRCLIYGWERVSDD